MISCENNLVSIVGEEETQTHYTTDGTEPTEENTFYIDDPVSGLSFDVRVYRKSSKEDSTF